MTRTATLTPAEVQQAEQRRLAEMQARLRDISTRMAQIKAELDDPEPDIREELRTLQVERRRVNAALQRPAFDASVKKWRESRTNRAKQAEGMDKGIEGLLPTVRAMFDAAVDEYEAARAVRAAAVDSDLESELDSLGYMADPRAEPAGEFFYGAIFSRLLGVAETIGPRQLKRGR